MVLDASLLYNIEESGSHFRRRACERKPEILAASNIGRRSPGQWVNIHAETHAV